MSAGAALSDLGGRILSAASPLVGFVRPDLGREIRARRAAATALAAWGEARAEGPLVWLHGASAGELLGAAPVVDELRSRRRFELLVTHFSPSGRSALEWLAPGAGGYPPLDTAPACDAVLRAVRPDVLVLAKLDVWPGLVAAAGRAGVPVVLVNGVVRGGSRRLGAVARRLFRPAYEALDWVGAATGEDAGRLRRLGVRPDALEVTGDAGFDLALARARRAVEPEGWTEKNAWVLPAPPPGGARLLGGSTWSPDERAILDALGALPPGPDGRFAWQAVLVPHKPDSGHVRRLTGSCRKRREPVARASQLRTGAALPAHGVVVWDEVGHLAELYTTADVAWVGGAIGGTGLHNVLEPAAAGLPVLFGPRHDRGDAAGLERAGGGRAVEPASLAGELRRLADPEARGEMGAKARAFVEAGAGSAVRTAERLEAYLPEARP